MRKKIMSLLIVTLAFSILVMGCQPQAARRPAEPNNQTGNEMTENERRVLAGRLSNLAEEIDGVRQASVIVSSIGITQTDTPAAPNTMPNNAPRQTVPTNPATDNTTNPGTTAGPNTYNTPLNPGAVGTNTPGAPNAPGAAPGTVGMNTPESLAPGSRLVTNPDTTVNNQAGLVVMVGLTLDQNLQNNNERVNTLKQTVANRLRGADPRITQVLVTSDPDLINRINDVATGLIEGRPIQSFENDIRNLGNRLRQEMPAF